MRVKTKAQSGYIALMFVLIVGAAATAISLTLLMVGTDRQREAGLSAQSSQARGLANACADEAMQQIHDNIAFSTNSGALSLGAGNCTYTVTVVTGTTRTVTATGTVGNVVRNVQISVTIGTSSISVTSWQEVT